MVRAFAENAKVAMSQRNQNPERQTEIEVYGDLLASILIRFGGFAALCAFMFVSLLILRIAFEHAEDEQQQHTTRKHIYK